MIELRIYVTVENAIHTEDGLKFPPLPAEVEDNTAFLRH